MPVNYGNAQDGVRERRRDERSGSVVSNLIVVVLVAVALVGAVCGKSLVAALAGLVLAIAVLARLWTRLALEEVTYACVASPHSKIQLIRGLRVECRIPYNIVEN